MPIPETTAKLVEIRFGSHLYGTSTPASDIDYKAVFIPPARNILLQNVKHTVSNKRPKGDGEKNYAGEIDEEAYALHRYLQLLSEGQTVALDMLFAPRASMRGEPAPLWHEIVNNRTRLVSKKAVSFVGYCRTQANKYGIRGSRVHAVRNIVEWFDGAITQHGHLAKLEVAAPSLAAFIADRALEHTSIIHIEHPSRADPIPHLECCNRKASYFTSLKDTRAIYARLLDEYGHRALAAERNEGVDWKALSHAVRVATEALEFLATGWITFPLPNAAHILAIKQGALPYAEVGAEIEALLEQVEAAQAASPLPDEPDHAFLGDLIAHAYGNAVAATLDDPGVVADLRGRVDRAATILQSGPDLNLSDYSRKQVGKLVNGSAQAWAELTAGKYPESSRHRTEEEAA